MIDSPRESIQSLPEDAAALRALVLATMAERDVTLAERDTAVTERDTLLAQNDRLRHLLLKLTRMHFGARSERLPEEQLQLGFEALEQAIAKTRRRRSVIPSCARTMPPSGGQAVAHCRRTCRESR